MFIPTLVPAILLPSLYQATVGVGLPATEQVRVRLPEDLTDIIAGGISFIRTNSDSPERGLRPLKYDDDSFAH